MIVLAKMTIESCDAGIDKSLDTYQSIFKHIQVKII